MRYRISCPIMKATVQSLDVALKLIQGNRSVPGWEPLTLEPISDPVSAETGYDVFLQAEGTFVDGQVIGPENFIELDWDHEKVQQ